MVSERDIEEMKRLRSMSTPSGGHLYTQKKIASLMGCSVDTVREYTKGIQPQQNNLVETPLGNTTELQEGIQMGIETGVKMAGIAQDITQSLFNTKLTDKQRFPMGARGFLSLYGIIYGLKRGHEEMTRNDGNNIQTIEKEINTLQKKLDELKKRGG